MSNIQEQIHKIEAEVQKLEEMGGTFTGRAKKIRDLAVLRFPITFVMFSTFGLVATFYGFEKIIDNTVFFSENPWMILFAGLLILTITGTLFKKLN